MPTLLWFRRDLRLHDLPPLLEAAATDDDVLACYVIDPRLTMSAGSRRLQFLYDCLRELNDRLDGRLLVTRGRPEKRIPFLVNAIEATSVYVSGDYSPFGRRRDEAVRTALGDIALQACGSPYLVTPGRVTKDDGNPYQVFTPYFRRWRQHGWRPPAASNPTSARWIDPADVSAGVDIPNPGIPLSIPAGETAAQHRWQQFVDEHLDRYAQDRDRPDLDATSTMSAYLKFGNIHPRTMAKNLDQTDPGPQAYLRELAFRDFYASVLFAWPASAWQNWNQNFDTLPTDTGADAEQKFTAWKDGRTGFPLVDAGMRQLRQTGFMHNRVRMVTASFLVKDLHLPWQWGARWFLAQLIDGDIASNQHGWQWAAGCGTDAAPYFRVFNPDTQATTFDPAGNYVRRWVPDIDTSNYPKPIINHTDERTEALRRYHQIN